MKYKAILTNRFKNEYCRMEKRGENMVLLDDVIELLRKGESLPTKYCDHVLKGNYKGSRECHIKPDWLLIYRIEEEALILMLMHTGSHSDLFG